jgi:FAD synthetase
MVPDEVSVISEAAREMSALYEVVLTSGGVGPTLDDVTMEAMAAALDTPLTR